MTKPTDIDVGEHRRAAPGVLGTIVERWSPRAMSGEPLEAAEREALFDAARWAPSCYNAQPWRFLYATRDSGHWESFFGLLVEGNQSWASRAAMLIVVLSRRRFEHNDQATDTNSFDAGAAWQNLALQGSAMGLVVHGMRGFDKDAAREVLGVPELYAVEAMVAVGRPGEIAKLSESQAGREKPSDRKAVGEIAAEGKFAF